MTLSSIRTVPSVISFNPSLYMNVHFYDAYRRACACVDGVFRKGHHSSEHPYKEAQLKIKSIKLDITSNTQIKQYAIEPLAGFRLIHLDEALTRLDLIKGELEQWGFAFVKDWNGKLSEWRHVRNYERDDYGTLKELGVVKRFAVTSSGLVIDFQRKEIRKPCGQENYNKTKGEKTYYYVTTVNYKDEIGKRKSEPRSIHQLVAEAFLGYRQGVKTLTGFKYSKGKRLDKKDSLVVNHLDEDTSNNTVGNLNVLTSGDNTRYSTRTSFSVMSPEGRIHKGDNLYRFCEEQALDYQGMKRMLKRKLGADFEYWTRYEEPKAA